jgi:lysophospholipase L1-like esterase
MKKPFICWIIVSILIISHTSASGVEDKAWSTVKCTSYTALGDSIAFGLGSSDGTGYTGLLYTYLKTDTGNGIAELNNLGKIGSLSSDLLKALQTDKTLQNTISKASVITISIGGNNLIIPVIDALSKAFHVNLANNTALQEELLKAIEENPNKDAIFAKLMNYENLPMTLLKSITQFGIDWVKIVAALKKLNSKAEIYVMTLYNPFKPNDPFYEGFGMAVRSLNSVITFLSKQYKVVDAYTLFHDYRGQKPLTGFHLFSGAVDPHPTDVGYRIIFLGHIEAYLNQIKGRSDETMSRSDFICILMKIMGLSTVADSNFADVGPENKAYHALGMAKKLGIATGNGKNRFIPDALLTHQDMYVFARRAMAASGKILKPVPINYLAEFSDASKIATYANDSVAEILSNEIIKVKGKNIYPGVSVKRSEVLELLKGLLR